MPAQAQPATRNVVFSTNKAGYSKCHGSTSICFYYLAEGARGGRDDAKARGKAAISLAHGCSFVRMLYPIFSPALRLM
jgi:hypothetical protein